MAKNIYDGCISTNNGTQPWRKRYVHDHLTGFLEEVKERAKFHYWLFGHYHDNKIINDRFVLLWEQMVQVV